MATAIDLAAKKKAAEDAMAARAWDRPGIGARAAEWRMAVHAGARTAGSRAWGSCCRRATHLDELP